MGVPETLVQRSAEARAKATGSNVDSIIQAWAGGETVAAAPAAAPVVEPEPEAPAPESIPEPPSVPAPESPPAAEAVEAMAPVALLERPAEESVPVVAESLSDRIAASARVGAVAGLVLGLIGWVFGSQFMMSAAGMIGEEEDLRASIAVQPGRLVVTSVLISVAVGLAVAGLVRMVPSWTSPGMKLTGSPFPSLAIGVLVGGLVGALAAAIMIGLGQPPELPDDPTQIPALAAIVWGLVAWVAGGWLIGALVQSLGVPEGVEPVDLDEVRTVKSRLVSAFGLPVMALLIIAVLVLSFAFVFLSFPSYSPLTGTVIAGSILGFAALSASKPNMRVGFNEIMVAAAGIGVVVVLIYAVLQTTGVGEHHEEGGEEGAHEDGTTEDGAGGEAPAEGDAFVVVLPV